ncbi:MAG TPA: hypothetical protein VMF55_16670 [Solirubrobacterales bacterium]|nr:hypothetical protein [Solirubrobacterales bacterium]
MSRVNIWRGGAILACVLASTAVVVAPAGAKPRKAFAPKVGVYGGDSIAGAKSHSVVAKVTKKGARYSAEVEIAFPATCTNGETGFTGPSELIYKVIAQVKGHAISFKGNSRDTMGILYPMASTVTLDGRFTSDSKFTATAAVKAPAEGVESDGTCSAPAVRLPFQFELPL